MIYQCKDCQYWFEEDELGTKETSWEEIYGVSTMFPGHSSNKFKIKICPCCDCEELDEYNETETVELLNKIFKEKRK